MTVEQKGLSRYERGIRLALEEAKLAALEGEVPVGAVVMQGDTVLAKDYNRSEQNGDMTAHAELLAMQAAAKQLGGRLTDCTLYVTLEPCAMCAGAAVNLRLSELVFGAYDENAGCCGSIADITDHWFLHSIRTVGGILSEDCAKVLSDFFADRRRNS